VTQAYPALVQPKYKFLLLIVALNLPYFGFVVYFATQFPGNQTAPAWFTNTLLVWFTANFLIATLLGKWIFRGQVVDAEKARSALATSASLSIRLVVLWILLFLYGVIQTVRGTVPLSRAVPGGAFHRDIRLECLPDETRHSLMAGLISANCFCAYSPGFLRTLQHPPKIRFQLVTVEN